MYKVRDANEDVRSLKTLQMSSAMTPASLAEAR
jgi:hypothetical protein